MNDPESAVIYIEINEIVEKITYFFHFAGVKITAPCVVLPSIFISFYRYFYTDLNANAFILPFPAWLVVHFLFYIYILEKKNHINYFLFYSRFPFDWRNPLVYLICAITQYLSLYNLAKGGICQICFTISSSLMLMAIGKDLKRDIHFIDEMNKTDLPRNKIRKNLIKFIQFHANAKELSILFY